MAMPIMQVVRAVCLLFLSALVFHVGNAQAQTSALRGKVVVDGSSTVYPITEAAAATFRKDYPGVDVTVAISGTGSGFKRFDKGETDLSDASRPITPKEFQAAKEYGVQFRVFCPAPRKGTFQLSSQPALKDEFWS